MGKTNFRRIHQNLDGKNETQIIERTFEFEVKKYIISKKKTEQILLILITLRMNCFRK